MEEVKKKGCSLSYLQGRELARRMIAETEKKYVVQIEKRRQCEREIEEILARL